MNYKKTQIFTPKEIVLNILDKIGYNTKEILFKKILEPSFGEGAFLLEIVSRYITIARNDGWSDLKIKSNMEKHIWGVEIDIDLFNKTINKLNFFLNKINFSESVNWNFYNNDALELDIYKNNDFNYIVGNPPYLGNHKISKELREKYKRNYNFCSEGNYNLYYAFYELFWKLKNINCKLCYISPNSFIYNRSAKIFRKKLIEDSVLVSIDNYQEYRKFLNKSVSVYPAIVLLDSNNNSISYTYNERNKNNKKFIKSIVLLNNEKDNLINFDMLKLKDKLKINFEKSEIKIGYGLATLADDIFICSSKDYNNVNDELVIFNNHFIEKNILKKIIKISTSNQNYKDFKYAIFPYKWNYQLKKYFLIDENELKIKFKYTYEYLKSNKDKLLNRSITKGTPWYAYGRTQALNDSVNNKKIGIRNLVNGQIIFFVIPKNCLFYSGMYIYAKNHNLGKLLNILENDIFYDYARIVGKDFSGDNKFITSTDIKQFFKLEVIK